MKRKPLALPLIGAAFLLGSCGGPATSSVPASSSSSVEETTSSSSSQTVTPGSSSSTESSSTSEPPLAATTIDAAYLATLASSSFEGKGTLTSYGVTTNIELFLGPSSLDFYDYDEYGIYYAADLYRKDEDGTTTAYMRDVDNKVLSSPLYVNESQTVEAPWDNYFYNPFGKLDLADLTLGEGIYSVAAAKVQAFSIPLMHYAVGTFDTATVARHGDTLTIDLGATDESGDPMEMKLELRVTTGDREVPAPFAAEEYHDAIGKALDTWTLALSGPNDKTGFVYEKTMTPLGRDDIEVAHSRSTVTYNATLFANDGGITSANDWGYALYDDGKYYEFEIVDGEPVRGEAYDGDYYPMPFPNIVAPEMFIPTGEEGTYVYRDGASALSAASLFLEDESVVAFLAYYGSVKDLTIHLDEAGKVDNFAYTTRMFDTAGAFYSERVSVDIVDFDTATIDYSFTVPTVPMPEAMKNTWTGVDTYTLDAYTLVIGDDGITLNGEAAELLGLTVDDWGAYHGTLKVGAASYDLTYMPADSYGPEQINLSNDDVYINLKIEAPVTMPAEIVGSWEGNDEGTGDPYKVVVTEDGKITINGVEATLGAWEETVAPAGGYRVEATVGENVYLLTYRPAAGTFRLTDETGAVYVDLQKVVEEPVEPAIDPKYVGTWTGVDEYSGLSHTLVINADATATLDGKAFEEPLEFRQVFVNMKATTTLEGLEYTLEYSEAKGTIRLYDENYDVDVVLTLQETPEAAPTLEFPEEFIGQWATKDGSHTLEFTAEGTILYDGTAAEAFVSLGLDEYTLTVEGVDYTMAYYSYTEEPTIMVGTPDGDWLMFYREA